MHKYLSLPAVQNIFAKNKVTINKARRILIESLNLTRSTLLVIICMATALLPASAYAASGVNINQTFYVPSASDCNNTSSQPASGIGDAYALTWPAYADEAGLALKMDEFIKARTPTSPYISIPNFSARLIAEAKADNTNPLIPLFIAVQESALGTSNVAVNNKNSFGNKGTPDTNTDGYREWPTFEDSFFGADSFTAGIPRRLANESGSYKDVENLSDYLSVHVSGKIIHAGEPTKVFDPVMNVYVDSSSVQTYFTNVGAWIKQVTGQTGPGIGSSACGSSKGPLPAGIGGYDLPNDGGSNPMVYYSQFNSGTNKSVTGYFGTKAYGAKTIQECGCGPTSLSTVVSTLTSNKIDPEAMAKWAFDNGYQEVTCGSSWFWDNPDGKFASTYKLKATKISGPSDIARSLQDGKLVVASVSSFPLPGVAAGHITVIRKYTNNKFYFADSFSEGWKHKDSNGNIAVPDVSTRGYSDVELASIINQAWEVSAQ